MRYMALDVGERRVGIAVSDLLGITAQGVRTIEIRKPDDLMAPLKELISEYEVGMLVVGLPLNMDGTSGKKVEEIRELGELLHEKYGLPVIYQDERLSTRAVETTLITADVSRNKRRKVVDKLAAVYILQGYLDR
ncbi:MAG: Holliday junction resolvase RuvX, partial [Chitinophagales bacterium]